MQSWNCERMFTPHHMSYVRCLVSFVMCHLSLVRCHVPFVTCQVSHVTCHFYSYFFLFLFDKLVGLVDRGSGINGGYPVYFGYETVDISICNGCKVDRAAGNWFCVFWPWLHYNCVQGWGRGVVWSLDQSSGSLGPDGKYVVWSLVWGQMENNTDFGGFTQVWSGTTGAKRLMASIRHHCSSHFCVVYRSQGSVLHWGAGQCIIVQFRQISLVLYSSKKIIAVLCSTVLCSAVQCRVVESSAVQY